MHLRYIFTVLAGQTTADNRLTSIRDASFAVQTSLPLGARQVQMSNGLLTRLTPGGAGTSTVFHEAMHGLPTGDLFMSTYHNYLDSQPFGPSSYYPTGPMAPTMTPQNTPCDVSNTVQSELSQQLGAGSAASVQGPMSPAVIEAQRQRLQQQRAYMAYIAERQLLLQQQYQQQYQHQSVVHQNAAISSAVPQMSMRPPQSQPELRHSQHRGSHLPHQEPRTPTPVYGRSNQQGQMPYMPPTALLHSAPMRIGSAQHLIVTPVNSTQDFDSSKRKRMQNPNAAQEQPFLKASMLHQNVCASPSGSVLRCPPQTVNMGRQYPRSPTPTPNYNQSRVASSPQQQQHQDHVRNIQDMTGQHRHSGFVSPSPQQQPQPGLKRAMQDMSGQQSESSIPSEPSPKRLRVAPGPNDPHTPSKKSVGGHSTSPRQPTVNQSRSPHKPTVNQSRTPQQSTINELRAKGKAETQARYVQTQTSDRGTYLASIMPTPNKTKVQPQVPRRTVSKTATNRANDPVLSPAQHPQQATPQRRSLSDEETAWALRNYWPENLTQTTNPTDPMTSTTDPVTNPTGTWEEPPEHPLPIREGDIFHAPLTNEQNSRAHLANVKADMERRGPSVGTNPDYTTPAPDRFIVEVLKKWTADAKRVQDATSTEPANYVPASQVMKSAAGYKRQR